MIDPRMMIVAVVVLVLGLLFFGVGSLETAPDMEPGAAVSVYESEMDVKLIMLDLERTQNLHGDESTEIKRIEYRVDSGPWNAHVLNGSTNLWIPLCPYNTTSLEVMGLRGDTLVEYEVFGVR